ncbi:MAG TPA: LLM class flavin-dependent oxidoreductase [Methylomirabilota bacterium]|jgi:alkanesulfonate monooxygenase SsuD/methylene tetrahydromethanopterin reductase-like flavin-dependent oxidoreductase (luciferase family)|nr:LLM class flavin-dependent oxidoreductase [Methylomirabilota bacterium]
MRIGVSEQSARKVRDPREGARWMIERAAAARRAGLDSLFVGDHHATPAPYYQNVPIIARMLAEWGAAPAGCLFLLPLWNPVLLAEQVGTLASIAEGRFIVQVGLGDDEAQFAAMGTTVRTRVSAFEQCLDAMRRLLAGEVVSGSGRFTFREARLALRPAEPVDVWIGASAPPAIDRAARLGDGFLAAPGATLAQAAEQIRHYRERCAAHGRTPSAIAVRRDVYVADSRADAEAATGAIVKAGYRGFDPGALVIGTIDEVVARFRALGELGATDVIVRHVTDEQPYVLASLARLAQVRKALA